jgi:AcrR family transcriptional regulator
VKNEQQQTAAQGQGTTGRFGGWRWQGNADCRGQKLLQELTPAQVTIAAIAREAGADPALVRYYFGSREALLLEVTQQIALQAEVETRSEDLTPEAGLEDLIHRTFRFTRSARYMQRLMAEELSSVRSPEVREKLRKWQSMPVEAYQALLDADHDKQLTDFSPLFVHLAVIGISDFFHSGEEVVKMLVPEGTDLAALEQEYEAFVPKLLLDGLRRR